MPDGGDVSLVCASSSLDLLPPEPSFAEAVDGGTGQSLLVGDGENVSECLPRPRLGQFARFRHFRRVLELIRNALCFLAVSCSHAAIRLPTVRQAENSDPVRRSGYAS